MAGILILVMLNKIRCHAHFQIPANQITWSRLLIQILNGKQCRSRSVGFFRSQMIWIYTVCKGRVYLGSAGQGLTLSMLGKNFSSNIFKYFFLFSQKTGLKFYANCLLKRQSAWNVNAYFLEKTRKVLSVCHLLNLPWEWYKGKYGKPSHAKRSLTACCKQWGYLSDCASGNEELFNLYHLCLTFNI